MSNRLERVSQRGAAIRAEVASLTDGLGRRLDSGITELVVALRLHGFRTTASCAGHLDHGLPWPWVRIGPHHDAGDTGAPRRLQLAPEMRRLRRLLDCYLREAGEDGPHFDLVHDRLQPEGTPLVLRPHRALHWPNGVLIEMQPLAALPGPDQLLAWQTAGDRLAAWLIGPYDGSIRSHSSGHPGRP